MAFGELSQLTESEKKHLTNDEIVRGVRLGCHTFILGRATVKSLSENGKATVLTEGVKRDFTLAPTFKYLGVAVDVGTTTLAARLILPSGEVLAETGASNPQALYGADVISRIEASLSGNQSSLAGVIRQAIDSLITSLCKSAKRSPTEIDGAVITGNTVMLYLLTETSPEPLSHAPFSLSRPFGEALTAKELLLSSLSPETEIYLPPCISAFIGADTVCAILASDLCAKGDTELYETSSYAVDNAKAPLAENKTALLADIGTNGEMALWHGGKLYVCSTAAGPAFEGVGISMGMRGENGAIDKVSLVNGKLEANVIGGGIPKGICGSGLVDAVAALLDSEELDETGYLEDDEVTLLSPVTLTAKDIRMVQLAKSAISAGLSTLLHEAGTDEAHVSVLYIAGGFGNYLNKRSAGRIGLLPQKLIDKTENIGNAALIGAETLLLDKESRIFAEKLSIDALAVELSTNKYFSDAFISGMMF